MPLPPWTRRPDEGDSPERGWNGSVECCSKPDKTAEAPDHRPELAEQLAVAFAAVRARLMRRSREEHSPAEAELPAPPSPAPSLRIRSVKHRHRPNLIADAVTKRPPQCAIAGSSANLGCEKRRRMASSSISNISHCCFSRLDEVPPSSAERGGIIKKCPHMPRSQTQNRV